jgi:hypothetical protein
MIGDYFVWPASPDRFVYLYAAPEETFENGLLVG